jgi:bifunctional UDP-N-acetylglucosamine pyrophosphorylase/glucosamine-1-phosphate N-acetyltransferase
MLRSSEREPELKAVVLAAGEGLRLRPLTDNRPKHLLPVACKPILQHLAENLATCGISDVILVVGRWRQVIAEALEKTVGRSLRISYAIQTGVLGTADAVRTARDYVEDEPFIVLYGDIYTTTSAIERVIETFRNGSCEAAMAVAPVSAPQFFGIVTIEDGYVKSVVEKPSPKLAVGNLANAGIFVFSPGIFEAIGKTDRSERNELEITQSLKILMNQGGKIKAIALESGAWKDIGRPWDLLEANELALRNIKPSIQGMIEEGARLIGPVIVDKGAVVRSGAYVEGPVIISEGAEIGPNSYIRPFSSVGRNVRIGSGCEVKNSIVMNDTKIPHLSYVGDSIIGERCNLGAGTIVANLRFDGQPVKMMISRKMVDTGRRKLGAVLGDEVQTGINVSIMPGVKIGSHSTINPGLTIYRDVPSRSKVISSQRPGRM